MARKKIESTALPVEVEDIVEEAKSEKEPEFSPQDRINLCNAEITEVLKRHNCDLFVSVLLEPPNNVKPMIRIIPKQ